MNTNPESLLGYANYLYIAGAIIALFGTFGIVYYSNVTSKLKDAQVKQYQKEADLKIASANLKAAESSQKDLDLLGLVQVEVLAHNEGFNRRKITTLHSRI